ncbi:hypothetical protein N656DRAFT_718965 [Canariomyces notabilis]|uniref:Uncharacterized protein n=1 Tax=Canariomyces notabilis TaxID=2074819 RepID=A0AAN6QIM3_9PEZI|nr:hypothetical protein N656DRAFT_718965 [Canariomyces arenarius]
MRQTLLSVAALSLTVASASAASVVYVTDLTIYSALSAISYNVQAQTGDKCPEAVTELQSCICTKNNNFASISSVLSYSVSYSCGSTASEDQTSAAYVLSAYCNQESPASFPTPTAVSAYITDIPDVGYLAPCAQSGLSYAIQTLTYARCPPEAPALASCACSKNQNSLLVSQLINSSVKYSCSSIAADVSSAHAMFAAYCAMNNGTTSFPKPSNPPGDMTYYITDLPQFGSLAPCAANALSYVVQSQTRDLCPEGPQALASCVCIKEGMTAELLKVLTSSVKYSCDSTATEDVSSAVSVYNYYCSAAQAQVTAAGITVSVEQTYPAGITPGTASPRQTGGSTSGSGNGNGSGSGNSGGQGAANQGDDSSGSSGPNVPVIVGVAVGVVAGLGLLAGLIFFLVKSAKKRRAMEQLPIPDSAGGDHGPQGPFPLGPYGGKAELASDAIAAPPPPASPSPSTLRVNAPVRADTVSPVSALTGVYAPPPNKPELQGQPAALYPPMPNTAELQGQGGATYPPPAPGPPPPNAPELYGQGFPQPNRPELQGHVAPYPMPSPSPNRSELQGQGSPFHSPNPNRPELAGQYGYAQSPQQPHHQQQQPQSPQPYPSPQQQQAQGYYHYQSGSPPPVYGQQQPHPPWQSGPVPGFHEMDGGGYPEAR